MVHRGGRGLCPDRDLRSRVKARDQLIGPSKTPEPDHHFWLELYASEREAIVLSLRGKDTGLTTKQLTALRDRVRDARRFDGPKLDEATLDWAELEAAAVKQGCSQADVIWDRGKGKE